MALDSKTIQKLENALYQALYDITNNVATESKRGLVYDKWWTGHQKSYTYPGETEVINFWTGNRKHGWSDAQPLKCDLKGHITLEMYARVQDLGNWNGPWHIEEGAWWREVPEEELEEANPTNPL